MDNAPTIKRCDQYMQLLETKFLTLQQTQTNLGCSLAFTFRVVGKTPQFVTSYNFIQKLRIIVVNFKIFRKSHTLLSLFCHQHVQNKTCAHFFFFFLTRSAVIINVQQAYSDRTMMILYQRWSHSFNILSNSDSVQSPLSWIIVNTHTTITKLTKQFKNCCMRQSFTTVCFL